MPIVRLPKSEEDPAGRRSPEFDLSSGVAILHLSDQRNCKKLPRGPPDSLLADS